MKTAAYTICKNEIKKLDQWLYYTKDFDYRVVLDTGSTDGTFQALQKVSNIILNQLILDEFKFDIARNTNLMMIPQDVDWCLSPDMDEYFSINVLDQITKTEAQFPHVTNISCARLDIYSDEVFVGQPKHIGTNKIHRRHLYEWRMPVYEHLSYIGPGSEAEIYNPEVFLIHDQDINKPRNKQYLGLFQQEHANNPQNTWNNWYLTNEYFKRKDMEGFVTVGTDFCKYHDNKSDSKYREVLQALTRFSQAEEVPEHLRSKILEDLNINPA
jgi:hypothetical protein